MLASRIVQRAPPPESGTLAARSQTAGGSAGAILAIRRDRRCQPRLEPGVHFVRRVYDVSR